jgi:hypothetical protein
MRSVIVSVVSLAIAKAVAGGAILGAYSMMYEMNGSNLTFGKANQMKMRAAPREPLPPLRGP